MVYFQEFDLCERKYINPYQTKTRSAHMLTSRGAIAATLLFCLQSVAAYDCNVTFFGEMETETNDMCNYVNYHTSMLVVCGVISALCFITTVLHIVCNSDLEIVENYMYYTIIFLILMVGFEGVCLAFLSACLFTLLCRCLSKPALICVQCTHGAAAALHSVSKQACASLRSMLHPLPWPSMNLVFHTQVHVEPPPPPSLEVMVEAPPPGDEVVEISIVAFDECTAADDTLSYECPICFESGGDSNAWFTTKCRHSFHLACINKCVQDSCPLCRRPMFFP